MLCENFGCEVVQLGSDISGPADARFFQTKRYPAEKIDGLPEDYYLLLLKSRIIFHRRGNISLGGFFRWCPGVVRELMRWQPDLIFENPYLTLTPRSYMTYYASRELGIPLVFLDCGDIMPSLSLKHKISLIAEKPVVNNAAALITYNEAGKKRFMTKYGFPEEKFHVIPKPVDTSMFNPNIDSRDFKRKYALEGKFVVSYFGRLCANKGAHHLLETARIMHDRGVDKNIVFLFVGGNIEPADAANFKALFERFNQANVRLTGKTDYADMPAAYASSNIAIFPDVTNLPGFPTVLAESMAAGLPIIIGIKGWEDAIPLVDGQNGLIIEPRNPRQMADAIDLLKTNDEFRIKLKTNVLAYAQNEMAYDRVVARYFELFNHLTKRTDHVESRDNRRAPVAV